MSYRSMGPGYAGRHRPDPLVKKQAWPLRLIDGIIHFIIWSIASVIKLIIVILTLLYLASYILIVPALLALIVYGIYFLMQGGL